MLERLGRFRFSGIRSQIAVLVLASLIGTQLLIMATFLLRGPDRFGPPEHRREQFEIAVLLIAATPEEQRPQLVEQITRTFPHLELRLLDAAAVPPRSDRELPEIRDVARTLGPLARVFALPGAEPPQVGIALPDGTAIAAAIPEMRGRPPISNGPWMSAFAGVIISLAMFGLWADRALSTPLSEFAAAAENFKLDGTDEPLAESGPDEIRSLARAMNRSRNRITALIDDRTRTLAAIGHDLRTPITRLRLRSEFIEDATQRDNMLRDLDQMRSMLDAVLSFLRTGRALEPMTRIDLASTLQLITDQFTDLGHKVTYLGPEHAELLARPDDIRRAVTNLVDNAVRYGKDILVRLEASPGRVTIEVEDDGPGIPEACKADVIEPFVRGDDARNMDETSGFGLGLSIARTIVQNHGGELTLRDRKPHGLIVRLDLPGQQQDSGAA
ncbi:periplasmic sensor signal transduction histidine kinase [Rhodopseudomonas palustris HaA2]|uniref:histidine kinase n=1 Tax=Rhodopseudomonas palustris (strain HaA2) TaxID=316058 RepID=Q2IYP2_RHOP2|nr:ATP-binding protein [Rhodopseudomonas palustris]ABD06668.1 periplasmic sensor signal transduction histidine kinase [Rhodopseudomonas palustris HaA2]